jgi:large subunit ribosomal protein L11
MAKKVTGYLKLQVPAGAANPSPPIGPALGQRVQSGSKAPGRDKAGKVTKAQVREIAEKKMKDLNCDSIEAAMKMVEGSARSMGLEVAG